MSEDYTFLLEDERKHKDCYEKKNVHKLVFKNLTLVTLTTPSLNSKGMKSIW
jgi:hypothetical protein